MTCVVPTVAYTPPLFRVLWSARWSGDETTPHISGTSWATLNQPTAANEYSGVRLGTISRRSLPEIGEATFYWEYGLAPGRIDDALPTPPILIGYEVRLQLSGDNGATWKTVFWGQVLEQTEQPNVGAIGDGTTDTFGGAFGGRTIYRVLDGLARTRKWPMNRHGFDPGTANGAVLPEVVGHPGYNFYVNGDVALLGNKSSRTYQRMTYAGGARAATGPLIFAHAWQGAFAANQTDNTGTWTDAEAVDNALAAARPYLEPHFQLREGTDGYQTYSAIGVDVGEPVFGFLSRVLNRSRGRGVAQLKWKDLPSGALEVWIGVTPLNVYELSAVSPRSGTTLTITGLLSGTSGATPETVDYGDGHPLYYKDQSGETLPDWDLRGDSRNIDSLFYYSSLEAMIYDALETVGEQIEVAATLSLADTTGVSNYSSLNGTLYDIYNIYDPAAQNALAPRWSSEDSPGITGANSDVSQMYDITAGQYWSARFSNVYQAFGLPFRWNCRVGDAKGTGDLLRCDYRCADDGSIISPDNDTYVDTPQNSVEILSTTPFLSNYDYSHGKSTQTPYDSGNPNGMPFRRNSFVIAHLNPDSSNDFWYYADIPTGLSDTSGYAANMTLFNPAVSISPDTITLESANAASSRMFCELHRDDDNSQKLAGTYDVTALAFTVTLRMPHRLRMLARNLNTSPVVPIIVDSDSCMNGQADTTQACRIRTINVPGAHLWLAHPHCVWDLTSESSDIDPNKGSEALRAPLGAAVETNTPGILRDDRDRMLAVHLLAKNWYLDSFRTRIRVGQAYCGLLPFVRQGASSTYTDIPPALGDYIGGIYANEEAGGPSGYSVNTIVTQIDYNHAEGVTMWVTDYFDVEPGILP